MQGASEILFGLVWCFAVFAWFRSVGFQVQAARSTTPGRHWWFRMNSLDPIFHPDAWPPEARLLWRRHLLWAMVFVVCIAFGFLIAYLAGWPGP